MRNNSFNKIISLKKNSSNILNNEHSIGFEKSN